MSKINKTWGAGLVSLAMAFAAPAWSQDVTADTVVATVGGVDITVGHMIAARNTLPQQYQAIEDAVLWDGVLDQLIQQHALAQSLGDDVTKATEFAIDNTVSGLLAGEALGKYIQSAVTEDALKAAYEAKFADAEPSREYNASHILVASEDEAKALKTELDAGADFAALAREKSTGPSGPNGGELGWFGKGMMVPEFEAAVMDLETGQVSAPVQTQFGWHVVKLNDSRLAEAPALDTVRQELAAELEEKAVADALNEVMAKTDVTHAEIEIDRSVLSNLDLVAE